MTDNQQKIINMITIEISGALHACEHSRHDQTNDPDKIDAYISSYTTRINLLRAIRNQLELEFTVLHYDPR